MNTIPMMANQKNNNNAKLVISIPILLLAIVLCSSFSFAGDIGYARGLENSSTIWIKTNLTVGTTYNYTISNISNYSQTPSNIFILYDDFDDNNLNATMWENVGSSVSETGGKLVVSTPSNSRFAYSKSVFNMNSTNNNSGLSLISNMLETGSDGYGALSLSVGTTIAVSGTNTNGSELFWAGFGTNLNKIYPNSYSNGESKNGGWTDIGKAGSSYFPSEVWLRNNIAGHGRGGVYLNLTMAENFGGDMRVKLGGSAGTSVSFDFIELVNKNNVSPTITCTNNFCTVTSSVNLTDYQIPLVTTYTTGDLNVSTEANPLGGTITYDGAYTIHTFLTNGTFTVPSNLTQNVSVLIVGQGGSSVSTSGKAGMGGAGGGQVIYLPSTTISNGTYSVVVGNGSKSLTVNNAQNSSFNGIIARAGNPSQDASGGAGGSSYNSTNDTISGGNGYDSENGCSSVRYGGGGASTTTAGGSASSTVAGVGKNGTNISISGSGVIYGSGGGGSCDKSGCTASPGGINAGNGTAYAQTTNDGVDGTGGGAGGLAGRICVESPTVGGKGGSGIVIIRYLTNQSEPPLTYGLIKFSANVASNFTINETKANDTYFNLTTGAYNVTAQANGYYSQTFEINVSVNQDVTYNVTFIQIPPLDFWYNTSYTNRFLINVSNMSNMVPILINGTNGITINGQKQLIWTLSQQNIYFYYNNYSDYMIANSTSLINFEVESGNRTSLNPSTIWTSINASGIYHFSNSVTTIAIDSSDQNNVSVNGTNNNCVQLNNNLGYGVNTTATCGYYKANPVNAPNGKSASSTLISYRNSGSATYAMLTSYNANSDNGQNNRAYNLKSNGDVLGVSSGAGDSGENGDFNSVLKGCENNNAYCLAYMDYNGTHASVRTNNLTVESKSKTGWSTTSNKLNLFSWNGIMSYAPVGVEVYELWLFNDTKTTSFHNQTKLNQIYTEGYGSLSSSEYIGGLIKFSANVASNFTINETKANDTYFNLTVGAYNVTAQASGYNNQTFSINVTANQDVIYNLTMLRPLTMENTTIVGGNTPSVPINFSCFAISDVYNSGFYNYVIYRNGVEVKSEENGPWNFATEHLAYSTENNFNLSSGEEWNFTCSAWAGDYSNILSSNTITVGNYPSGLIKFHANVASNFTINETKANDTYFNLTVGAYNVTAQASGYYNQTFEINVTVNQDVTYNVTFVGNFNVTSVQNLTIPNSVYTLRNNVSITNAQQFYITANNVTFDMNGFSIIGNGDYENGINVNGYDNATIKNGNFENVGDIGCGFMCWGAGIYIDNSVGSRIDNVTGYSNAELFITFTNASNTRITNLVNTNSRIDGFWLQGNNNSLINMTNVGGWGGSFGAGNNLYIENLNSTSSLAGNNVNDSVIVNSNFFGWNNSDYYEDWSQINNVSIVFNNAFGEIKIQNITSGIYGNFTIGETVIISDNYIEIKSENILGINRSANLKLNNVPVFTNPRIMKNGIVCTDCSAITWNGQDAIFNVTGFSNYTIEETPLFNGTGTLLDPYQIANITQLNLTRLNLTANYKLMNDIDAGVFGGFGGMVPIGNDSFFTGTFDGNNKTISNLNINRASSDYVGLFGKVNINQNSYYNIFNLTIRGSITGNNFVGCAVGLLGGRIYNVKVDNCNVVGGNNVGGIVGHAGDSSLIDNSYVQTFYIVGNTSNVGLIAGATSSGMFTSGQIKNTVVNITTQVSYSVTSMDIMGNYEYGGPNFYENITFIINDVDRKITFNGDALSFSKCQNPAYTDHLSCIENGGSWDGVWEKPTGSIINYFNFGNNLVGANSEAWSGFNKSASIKLTGASYYANPTILKNGVPCTDCTNIVFENTSDECHHSVDFGYGLVPEYTNEADCISHYDWDFGNYYYVWVPGVQNSIANFDVAGFSNYSVGQLFQNGTGTIEDPYQITNITELDNIRYDRFANYTILNDINATGFNWTPLFLGESAFVGTIQGNGNSIINLTINLNETLYVAFVSVNEGIINNLTFVTPNITGGSFVGVVAGLHNAGNISNINISGGILRTGDVGNAGGITGYSYGGTEINNCYIEDLLIDEGYQISLIANTFGFSTASVLKNNYVKVNVSLPYKTKTVFTGIFTGNSIVTLENNTMEFYNNFGSIKTANDFIIPTNLNTSGYCANPANLTQQTCEATYHCTDEQYTNQGDCEFNDWVWSPYTWTVTYNYVNIMDNFIFGSNLIGLNSEYEPTLNISANVTINDAPVFGNPIVLKNGIACVDCGNISWVGQNATFTVTGFSNYSIGNGDASPIVNSSRISPINPNSTSTLQFYCNATDADDENLTYIYNIYENNTLIHSGQTGIVINGTELNIYNLTVNTSRILYNYTLECQANDSTTLSAKVNSTVTIQNTLPQMTSTRFFPALPDTTSNLVMYCTATDYDGQNLIYNYTVYKNNVEILNDVTTAEISGTEFRIYNVSDLTQGDNYSFSCKAYDGFNFSSTLTQTNAQVREYVALGAGAGASQSAFYSLSLRDSGLQATVFENTKYSYEFVIVNNGDKVTADLEIVSNYNDLNVYFNDVKKNKTSVEIPAHQNKTITFYVDTKNIIPDFVYTPQILVKYTGGTLSYNAQLTGDVATITGATSLLNYKLFSIPLGGLSLVAGKEKIVSKEINFTVLGAIILTIFVVVLVATLGGFKTYKKPKKKNNNEEEEDD